MDDAPPWLVDQHPVQVRLDPRQLAGDVLPQRGVVAQLLGADAPDGLLGLLDQGVELLRCCRR